jgi:LuxR family maltose regulon positive regulatory protein
LLQLGATLGLAHARTWGRLLLGAVAYEGNDLAAATAHLTAVLEAPDRVQPIPLRAGSFALALALQVQGRAGEADAVLDRLGDALLRTADAVALARVDGVRARLGLLRGDPSPARHWLASSGGRPTLDPGALVDVPALTWVWARLCLAPEAPSPAAALAGALADADALLAESERLHLVTRRAQALALRALAQDALGATDAALDSLSRALALGETSGLVRTFLDLGPPLLALLRRLPIRRAPGAYRDRLLAAAPTAPAPGRPGAGAVLPEPLTGRELEVLERLAGRWSNKEIAAELYLSPETVKSHVAHLCAKLGAAGRREAVRRAVELGLVPPA